VTIAIPCLDEVRFIEATVKTALEQRYPADRLEVIVADGGSTDGTLDVLARVAAADARLRVIDNPGRIQARAMNAIIRQARGDIVVRFDAHADYAPDYVKSAVRVLEATGADNVGGAQRPRAETPFQRALCAALSSPLGVGGAAYRSPDNHGWVDTVWLGAYRRRVFESVGLFDDGAITNEDAELNQRIVDNGGRVYLSPDIVAHYYPRDSWRSLARQYFAYGTGRARTTLKHRRVVKPRSLIPFASVVGAALLGALKRPLLGPCLGVYAIATGVEALRVSRHLGMGGVMRVWSMFPVLHTAHGIGFAYGLWRYARRADWREPEKLEPLTEHRHAAA